MRIQSESQIWKTLKSIYPIFIPYIVASAYSLIVYAAQDLVNGITQNFQVLSFMDVVADNLTIGTAICGIPVYLYVYRRDYKYGFHQESMKKITAKGMLLVFLAAAASADMLNKLISVSGIGRIFSDYVEIVGALYNNNLVLDVIGLGIIVPIAEELLFRGIIYNRIKANVGVRNGAIITSVIFAVYHGNIVQGIYAFFLSLLIIFAQEKYKTVTMAILFHMGANIISVLLQDTSLQNILYGNSFKIVISTLSECLIVILLILSFYKKGSNET